VVVGGGVLAGGGLSVADGLLVGDGLLAVAGVADGEAGGELTVDCCTVGAGTGIGSVVLAAELGNAAELGKRVMTGSVAGGLCLGTDGATAEDGEAAAWTCRPGWNSGPAAALFVAAAGPPAESIAPAR
jgi:hypothetical protein